MSYQVFDIEANKKDAIKEYGKYNRKEREIGMMMLNGVLEHQRVANERHNEAMLKKDIEIAELKASIKTMRYMLKGHDGDSE